MVDDQHDLNPHEKAAETRKKKTRAKILFGANLAIEEQGLSVTIEDIANEANVSPTTIYGAYPNKWWIFAEVFQEYFVPELARYASTPQAGSEELHRRRYLTALVYNTREQSALVRGAMLSMYDEPQNGSIGFNIGWQLQEAALPRGEGLVDAFFGGSQYTFWSMLAVTFLNRSVEQVTGYPSGTRDTWSDDGKRRIDRLIEDLLVYYSGVTEAARAITRAEMQSTLNLK